MSRVSIFETLQDLNLSSVSSREVFASGTRDNADLKVFRDRVSGVIYVDGFYVGDDTYTDGKYVANSHALTGSGDYEAVRDAERRTRSYRQFYTGRDILEFGCGRGDFLRAVQASVRTSVGVELQIEHVDALNADGIRCLTVMLEIPDQSIDCVLGFHVLEHIPDPLAVLNDLCRVLRPGGYLILEVPHARDFLLSQVDCPDFRKFTLWSQHLILHTRESLTRLCAAAGLSEVVIEGIQRYPLSNHLGWLSGGKPGGHRSLLSALDTPALNEAYEAALRKLDATDTLVAIARKPNLRPHS